MKLTHVPYLVPSYRQAQDFLEALGFSMSVDDVTVDGNRFLTMSPPDGGVELQLIESSLQVELLARKKAAGIVEFIFSVDDMDTVIETIRRIGLTVHREPIKTPYGTTAIFEDVFGYLWDLVER